MSKIINMKLPSILNKGENHIQITAEQLLKNAEMHREQKIIKTDDRIRDEEELNSVKESRRKQFEQKCNAQRYFIGHWIKYAQWEESLQEFRRARSVYERALELDYKNVGLWLKYIEMEMKHKFINHARNVFERAIDILPRVDQFWFKYAYMEEILGEYQKARAVFQRWMEWNPAEKAWMAFLSFEQRMNEEENCRKIMYQFMDAHPKLSTYLKVAKFEIKSKNFDQARQVLEQTLEDLGQEALKEEYFVFFANFETKNKEFDRAREIYRFGLENIPKEKSKKLYTDYLTFEKQFGKKDEIDDLIFSQRRIHYKQLIEQNSNNYDAWFDLVNLEIATNHYNRTVETFEAAVKQVPPIAEKRYWRRYIYLWYTYAVYEEYDQNNIEKSQQIFERALKVVPHKMFTFSKLWIMYANQQLRAENLEMARKIYGVAIGKCPTEKIFNSYIEMEMQLANVDKVRQLYQRYAEIFKDNPTPWIRWAELERSLDEKERYRGIFEIAINNNQIDMPETLWKAYIDNEIEEQEYNNVRELYERLLDRTQHVKVWLSYAQFEQSLGEKERCRAILQRGEDLLKKEDSKEERAILLENWKEIEVSFGDQKEIEAIKKKQPQRIIKKRKIISYLEDGSLDEDAGQEEYYDYIFPGDKNANGILKMMERAKMFKKEKLLQERQEKEQQQQNKEQE
ncbi:hypothetical protein PPERSA_07682 [Pseudocohnilembus persalinus]|uniref:Suppressor of forked domain-containing protein n=1 Tax=Pseudocohnilembus persalinus TaxID=266149 RepID=A0A0V0QJ20_PSEPJ|nr:hypothetical protein PPERSA_07682 [Pseudocohnilembus persalinus]|eukprot:KRX02037.1 hypothetical protein PPERSA_07682 [Pseudocohnilembus persalinus]